MMCKEKQKQGFLKHFLYFMLFLNSVLTAAVINNYFEIYALKEIIVNKTNIKEGNISEIVDEIISYEKKGQIPLY